MSSNIMAQATSQQVLVLDNVAPVCAQRLEERGLQPIIHKSIPDDPAERKNLLNSIHAMVLRSATTVDPHLIAEIPNLKVIGRAGVGVDNIDIDAATASGVLVMNTPDGNTISTAEHTCGMILALHRNIPQSVAKVKSGGWDRKKYMGTEIHDKKLGIVGLGKIGSEVARRMQSFGVDIFAYDPYTSRERAEEMDITLLELDELLATVDILTVHTPLTDATRNMISLEKKELLKKGIRLVNCARGGIIKEEDLPELIDQGYVAGAALDVYTSEPPHEALLEILKHPDIICTPHLGASTEEAQEKVATQIADQIADALAGKGFKGSLNGKSIALSTKKEVQPLLHLSKYLGAIGAQLNPPNNDVFHFEFSGHCAEHAEVLSDALLTGLLNHYIEEKVNLINARTLAEKRGLQVSETKTKSTQTFNDLVTIHLPEGSPYRTISGTVFGDQDYRIVDIDGFGVELRLEPGQLVLYKNIDQPGMLAAVSSTLADEEINIGSLSLGRGQKGSQAITALVIDRPLTEQEIQLVRSINGVQSLRYISLS
ncbi:MAG: phosphoglycerate dehydrogenase [Bacteroidota bacterium]